MVTMLVTVYVRVMEMDKIIVDTKRQIHHC
jgi:hypothetical protein